VSASNTRSRLAFLFGYNGVMQLKSVRDAQVSGKRVFLRVDFNVPLEGGAVRDDARIKAALPTINLLHEQGATKIIVATHLGRPDGRVVETLRTAPLAARLKELAPFPEIEMLENLRFNPGEEHNDEAFARELAAKADIYVDDAFANAHRAHASIVGVAKLLPAYAGLLMEREVERLSTALAPQRPALALVGGAKFETKIPLLSKLLERYDGVLLGGALGNDVLLARGLPVGASLVSDTAVPEALAGNDKLVAPLDAAVVTKDTNAGRTTLINDVRADELIVDIGTRTIESWVEKVAQAQFILWNGPLGIYERGYTEGTDALAGAIAKGQAAAVLGGGDTEAALAKFTFDPARVFVSTGGGAMLEFLSQGTLPGLEVLKA